MGPIFVGLQTEINMMAGRVETEESSNRRYDVTIFLLGELSSTDYLEKYKT